MLRFIGDLVRPYRGTLLVILLAMLVETLMSLAAPWPLKIILDNVVGDHRMSPWLHWLLAPALERGNRLQMALVAACLYVFISALGALASYIDNYFTESVGQWVAHDLRIRIYDHLHRLSLGYYSTHQTGTLLSTLTADVATVQDFASSATLSIIVDLMTIVGMLGLFGTFLSPPEGREGTEATRRAPAAGPVVETAATPVASPALSPTPSPTLKPPSPTLPKRSTI